MCPDPNMLIRLAAGELTAQARDALLEHLSGCPACREAYEQVAQTWDLLGEAEELPAPPDFAPALIATVRRRSVWRGRAAAAAAILLAAGVGAATAMLAPERTVARSAPPTTQEVAEVVGFELLADRGVLSPLFDAEGAAILNEAQP